MLRSRSWILSILAILGLMMQAKLWLSDDGYGKTRELRLAVSLQRQQNQVLKDRNSDLEAEMLNLKHGHEAAEERARTDLGMIGRNETFYQVVPASGTPKSE
ncbi:MAG: cell division protein FtsB [Gammaproteobacteria bacterium]|nr:MAG: cell division protein FtsB [Gammaproteobacteria bacterium]